MAPSEKDRGGTAAALEHQNELLRRENEKLKLREQQYNSILETMTEAVERDSADLIINYVNNAYCAFYGTTKEETIHTDAMEAVVAEDRERVIKKLRSVTPDHPDYHYTCRVNNSAGDLFWIEVFGHAFFDSSGKIREYQDISRDVTSYKSAEKQAEWFRAQMEEKVRERTLELTNANLKLSTANSYLQHTLNNISEGIIVVREDGSSVLLNYGSNAIWSAGEGLIREAVAAEMKDKKSPICRLFLKGESFHDVEITLPTAAGEIQYLVTGYPVRNENEPTQGFLILRPLSEMKHIVNRLSGAQARYHFQEIIAESAIMKEVIQLARRVAPSEGNIMIEGESGTGKELFAQSIHNASPRRNGPFIAVNCGAIPRDLIASELFGYAEGSFTGAKKGGKPGKFEMAAGGTIFLDEIGDMPLNQQIALLRVIQERVATRIGGTKTIPIDVRIVCATNKDLLKEVERNNFRRDLYYRLNVINLHIPPLRERKEDIPALFRHFLTAAGNPPLPTESAADGGFLDALMNYDWPGNVRELQNVTERATFVSERYPLTAADLPEYLLHAVGGENGTPGAASFAAPRAAETAPVFPSERERMIYLLRKYGNNASRAAKHMGISRTTFYRKLKKYGMTIDRG
ncbi:MAG: sigma 54-interacting transcriptional regulator [Bacillota bacterium]|jgi:PAS domain S-box-containing protein